MFCVTIRVVFWVLKCSKAIVSPKTGTGKTKFIRAKKAVILCYGGFSRDVEYRTMQDPKLTAALDSTNQPGATSELWRETSRIGCAQVQNDWIQCTPWNNPKERGWASAGRLLSPALLNTASGLPLTASVS